MRLATPACAALLALVATSVASAQTAPLKLAPASTTASAPLDLSALRTSFDLTPEQAEALKAGIARTEVDHRFAGGMMGQLGFLCGLHGDDYDPAAAMHGADPAGKFLGAKLSLAFR